MKKIQGYLRQIRKNRGKTMLEVLLACGIIVFSLTAGLQSLVSMMMLESQHRQENEARGQLLTICEEIYKRGPVSPGYPDYILITDWRQWLTQEGIELLPEASISVMIQNMDNNALTNAPVLINPPKLLTWTYSYKHHGHTCIVKVVGSILPGA